MENYFGGLALMGLLKGGVVGSGGGSGGGGLKGEKVSWEASVRAQPAFCRENLRSEWYSVVSLLGHQRKKNPYSFTGSNNLDDELCPFTVSEVYLCFR